MCLHCINVAIFVEFFLLQLEQIIEVRIVVLSLLALPALASH